MKSRDLKNPRTYLLYPILRFLPGFVCLDEKKSLFVDKRRIWFYTEKHAKYIQ